MLISLQHFFLFSVDRNKGACSPIIQTGLQYNSNYNTLGLGTYLGHNWLSSKSAVTTILILVESRPWLTAQRLAKREIAVYKFQMVKGHYYLKIY